MYVEYSSNNSGGKWWLTDEDWNNLEKAGWEVNWFKTRKGEFFKAGKDGKWLGALASSATLRNISSLEEAVSNWEQVTNKFSTSAGCPCCGPPHHFSLYDDDNKFIDSGPKTNYYCSWQH